MENQRRETNNSNLSLYFKAQFWHIASVRVVLSWYYSIRTNS